MNCPKCKSRSKVKESATDGKTVFRKRICVNCGNVFFSTEDFSPMPEITERILGALRYKQRKDNEEI